jgi:hypothetical protein
MRRRNGFFEPERGADAGGLSSNRGESAAAQPVDFMQTCMCSDAVQVNARV